MAEVSERARIFPSHLDPVIKAFRQWAVTDYGLERIDREYPIPVARLWETDWIQHVTMKNGVDADDFIDAYHAALAIHAYARPRGLMGKKQRLRYEVLRRDGFRCQLCGRTAAHEGVKLEVDHIFPRSKGGEDTLGNLQTLCWDCNSGKSNLLMEGED
jgi:HNH endonuclease